MKTKKAIRTLLLVPSAICGLMLSGVAGASTVVLPYPNELSAGLYGDFTVYSLDLLAQCQPYDVRCQPYSGDKGGGTPQLIVNSQSLDDQMIVYRNENGTPTGNYTSGPLTGGTILTSGVDNPFDAPTGGSTTSFNMTTSNEPMTETAGTTGTTKDFNADRIGTWEAKLSTVKDYITGNAVVFLFDNNQVGSSYQQQQFFWATLQILDANGNAVPGLCYELTSGISNCSLGTEYTDLANPGEFVGSGGGFCVDKTTGASYLLAGNVHPTKQADCGTNYFVNNNLGQNSAEFAVTLDALNKNLDLWASLGYSMSINFKMRNLNDGGEELWICSDCRVRDVPEPGVLALFGLGLAGMMITFRRRRQS